MNEYLTIKDIAKEAGVSITTVSRVMNGNYPVSDKTRQRVEATISRLQYNPNNIARSLRAKQTNSVGVIVPDIANHFYMEVAKGLELELSQHGFQLLISSSNYGEDIETVTIKNMVAWNVDAVIMITSLLEHFAENFSLCKSRGIPVVLADCSKTELGASQVRWNSFKAAYDLTNVLIAHGHTQIGIVNTVLDMKTEIEYINGKERLQGFQASMKAANLVARDDWSNVSNLTKEDAHQTVLKMMRKPEDRPTALFCVNNVTLEGTLSALEALGLQVGKDVSVAAFGSLDCNKYIKPRITCAVQDGYLMGKRVGEIVHKTLLDQAEHLNVSTSMVVIDPIVKVTDSVQMLEK